MYSRPILPLVLLSVPALLGACGSAPAVTEGAATEAEAVTSARGTSLTVDRVLLLSIDGMHEVDLARFLAANPGSALAKLAKRGLRYAEAHVNALDGSPTSPSDSFPGVLALTTGGSAPTTGVWYDVSYARELYADASCATPGTAVTYDESIDTDGGALWGATAALPTHDPATIRARLDVTKLPYRKTPAGCFPVYPHEYLRVNTVFEVAHAAGLRTAWSDKHPAYELVSGPSGTGLDDLFAPEINSLATNLPGTGAAAGEDFTTKAAYTEVYDDLKVRAILKQIDGRFSDDGLPGATDAGDAPGVPSIFGMNFQAVSVAQKDAKWGPGGYLDAAGTPSAELADALAHTDASIGAIVDALTAHGLLDSTLIVVTSKHGQSPIDESLVARRDGDAIAALVDGAAKVAGHIEDDVAMYWLADPGTAPAGAAALVGAPSSGGPTDPSVDRVFLNDNADFVSMFGDPRLDPHTPDLVVQPNKGTIYSLSSKKQAEHGGFADDDSRVALLVSNPALRRRTIHEAVRTKQVAPTILAAVGLDPRSLEAVQKEGTEVLPGLRFQSPGGHRRVRWTADVAPAPVKIEGGPWTLAQLAPGTPVPPPVGTTLTNRSYGYCTDGVRSMSSGVASMQPYYFPMVIGRGDVLQGFFDWRPKDINESVVAARSTDGGRTWRFQQEAFELTTACPVDITQTSPDAHQADNGFGHPYVFEVGGVTRLYVLDRSDASIDNLGLVVSTLDHSRHELNNLASDPLSPLPGTIAAATPTRTVGLLNPDGILGVVTGGASARILYIQKQKGGDNTGATALPASQQCGPQPYLQPGAKTLKAANHDLVTVRLASTTDGVSFTDLGPVSGLSDPTTTSYLGTRYVAPSGTLLRLENGRFGLFFAGGNCLDADSDAFHYIGYAESDDLQSWTVVNGIDAPIASLATNEVPVDGAPRAIPAQMPVLGAAADWFKSRVYSPSVVPLDGDRVTLIFAGYGVQSPNSDLLHYRQIGQVVLKASQRVRAANR